MTSATVHLLCGMNAAGKSTLARRLAADLPARRYCLDERLITRFPSLDYATEEYGVQAAAEREHIWQEAVTALTEGTDVVLDWNCWQVAHRAAWASRARDGGWGVVIHWVDLPVELAVERSRRRSAAGEDGCHRLREDDVRALGAGFERPTPEEGLRILHYDHGAAGRAR